MRFTLGIIGHSAIHSGNDEDLIKGFSSVHKRGHSNS